MSGYHNITFSCDHTERVLIDGNLDQQKHEILHKQSGICSKCHKEWEHKQVVANSKGLPTLIGTEKQIVYAMSLRLNKINKLKESIENTIVFRSGAYHLTEEEKINMAKEKYSGQQLSLYIEKLKEYTNLVNELKRLETEASAVWIIESYKS